MRAMAVARMTVKPEYELFGAIDAGKRIRAGEDTTESITPYREGSQKQRFFSILGIFSIGALLTFHSCNTRTGGVYVPVQHFVEAAP